ncbi:MAG: Jag N-terminal domain-containing protein [Candidatus Aminicenantes bacterium]|nr:MAG: Jag N-terminal domain-containing protein [Candidatus Aminicenantes bacterium]
MEKKEKNKNTDNDIDQEFKGRNLEDAISLAELTLKLQRTQFNYEVVTEKTKLFGIGSKEIVIRTWPKRPAGDYPAARFLEQFLSLYPLEIRYQIKEKNDMLYFIFDGMDKYLLLRKDGSLLLALQHLLNKMSTKKVQTDCDFFRKRKEREIKEKTQEVAHKVQETGEKEILDFMNPYERRIVHIAANQVPGITSESIGDGFLKQVKIFPSKE